MRIARRALLRALPALALPAALSLRATTAHGASAGEIRISLPWTRAAGRGATGVGYMTLHNTGTAPDRLVSATSPAARAVELHTQIQEGGIMRMRPVEAVALPPGEEVRLAPGGLHLMLMGLTRPLEQGERVPLTLSFERAGDVEVELVVESAGARAPSAARGHAH